MKRKERTQVLVEGSPEISRRLAADIRSHYTTAVVREPHEVLIMNRARETAANSTFYLGEALVCEAQVQLEETIGLGLILGDDRTRALDLAVIDAAFSQPTELSRQHLWEKELRREKTRIVGARKREEDRLKHTKVDFSLMDTENLPSDIAEEEALREALENEAGLEARSTELMDAEDEGKKKVGGQGE